MSSVLGVSVGAGAIRLARPPVGVSPGVVPDTAVPESFELRTFTVPPETPSAERAALSVAAALNSNPEITATVLACRDEQQARALHTALSEHALSDYEIVPDIEAVVEFAVASGALKDVSSLAVFDLGSSGLSVTVVDVSTRQVRHTERTGDISGEYFDSLIREQQINSGRIAHPPDPAGLAELDALCRSAKERLSGGNAVALPSGYGPVLLTQENFTALIGRAVETSARATREVIERSGRPVQAVLAVGGGTRIPLVSRVLREAVDMPVLVPPGPETATARGAALLARRTGAAKSYESAAPGDTTGTGELRVTAAAGAVSTGSGAYPGQPGPTGATPGATAPIPHATTARPAPSPGTGTGAGTTSASTGVGEHPAAIHPDSVPPPTAAPMSNTGTTPAPTGSTAVFGTGIIPTDSTAAFYSSPAPGAGPAVPAAAPQSDTTTAFPDPTTVPTDRAKPLGPSTEQPGAATAQPGSSLSLPAPIAPTPIAETPAPHPGIFGPPTDPPTPFPMIGSTTAHTGDEPDNDRSTAASLPHPISTPIPRLSAEEDPPTIALRVPAKSSPRRSFGEPPRRPPRRISAAMVVVSVLVVVASIGIGLGYGQHIFSQDSATVQTTSPPPSTSVDAPLASTVPPSVTATPSEHASLAEPPPVHQPKTETPPTTTGPNTFQVPGLPPIVVPTIPPGALPFPHSTTEP